MNNESMINTLLERIQKETGIVLKRDTDREKIQRFIENGGEIPKDFEPLSSALINLITVNETYFERESYHFDRLINEILPNIETASPILPIRVLTAPCSSGEESYTIALRILAMGKKISRPIEIVGIDISEEMIYKANRGCYSERSVHALSQEVLEHYFFQTEEGYRLYPIEEISIHFISGNLFDDKLWEDLGDFDVIFSRNMMIYFDADKNKELLLNFKKHLKGYLILGHADDHLNAKKIFTPLRGEGGNIYTL